MLLPPTANLLRLLHAAADAGRTTPAWPADLLPLLEAAGTFGHTDLLGLLTFWTWDEDCRVAAAATGAITGIVAGLGPVALARLDPEARYLWPGLDGSARLDRLAPAELGLASMHRDGQVRVAAVRRLGRSDHGSELAFLLLRLNDWVDPVRVAAREA